MTASREPDSLIHRFVLEGEDQLQDQVYDAVRAEIERRRQRDIFGPWRLPEMNKFLAVGLGAAAVVVALFVGVQLFGSPEDGVDNEPTPSQTLERAPEPTLRTHVLSLPGDPIAVRVTIPAAGWSGEPGGGVLSSELDVDPPNGAGIITFVEDDGYRVYGDPCTWSTTPPDGPATTVDELVAALSDQASRDASAPVDITLDGYAGKSITLHVPDDADFAACDEELFASWGTRGEDPSRHHQGPGQIDKLWILDVDGHLVVIDTAFYAGTPQEVIDELDAIVETATFGE
jgi:hypothetical protein